MWTKSISASLMLEVGALRYQTVAWTRHIYFFIRLPLCLSVSLLFQFLFDFHLVLNSIFLAPCHYWYTFIKLNWTKLCISLQDIIFSVLAVTLRSKSIHSGPSPASAENYKTKLLFVRESSICGQSIIETLEMNCCPSKDKLCRTLPFCPCVMTSS